MSSEVVDEQTAFYEEHLGGPGGHSSAGVTATGAQTGPGGSITH